MTGQDFKKIREAKGITVKEMAEKAGVSRQTVWAFERDKKAGKALRLIEAYGAVVQTTVMGYGLEEIRFARQLMAEGITPHELREHYHDFVWVANTMQHSFDETLRKCVRTSLGGIGDIYD